MIQNIITWNLLSLWLCICCCCSMVNIAFLYVPQVKLRFKTTYSTVFNSFVLRSRFVAFFYGVLFCAHCAWAGLMFKTNKEYHMKMNATDINTTILWLHERVAQYNFDCNTAHKHMHTADFDRRQKKTHLIVKLNHIWLLVLLLLLLLLFDPVSFKQTTLFELTINFK